MKKIFTIIMPFVFTIAGIFGVSVDVNADEKSDVLEEIGRVEEVEEGQEQASEMDAVNDAQWIEDYIISADEELNEGEIDSVDDLCFFNVYGYMYVDVVTYDKAGVNLYYANPYGVMECNGWFQFSEEWGGGTGYANADGTLMCNTYTYDQNGNYVYIEGNGNVRGTSTLVARFTGVGDEAINKLSMPNGVYRVVCKCTGYDRDNFIVWTYKPGGSIDELWANEIVEEGETMTITSVGLFEANGGYIDITANGEWTVTFYSE